MKNNWSDGKFIKKLEKRFLQQLEKDYEHADGTMYVGIDSVELIYDEEYNAIITLCLRYGREDEKYPFQRELTLTLTDGNMDFLLGQFVHATYMRDTFAIDGKL